jgi:hypothetical protein
MMSKSNLTVHQPSGLLSVLKGDQTATEAAALQKQAFLARTRRSAERDLGLLEMGDVEALAMRGIVVAGNTAAQAVAEIEANPCSTDGVGRILKTANAGLDRVLRQYIDEE